ncbi:MAG: hypothetical protein E7206_04760 [Clostridium beijerinckii]|nr:hypothetical protein [Clostridium beijerinckii]
MKNIFKELSEAYQLIRGLPNEELRLKGLCELEKYITNGIWYTGKNKDEDLKSLNVSIRELAHKSGKSENSVLLQRKRMSDKIRSCLGSDILSTIIYGEPSEVKQAIRKLLVAQQNYKADDIIIPQVLSGISRYRNNNDFDLADIQMELDFIKLYSIPNINKTIPLLDPSKLSYLIQILNSTENLLLAKKTKILYEIFSK